MTAHEDIGALPPYMGTVAGLSEDHPLAIGVRELTSLDTIVVEGRVAASPQEAALHAARTALAYFGPKHTAEDAANTVEAIDLALRENTVGGKE